MQADEKRCTSCPEYPGYGPGVGYSLLIFPTTHLPPNTHPMANLYINILTGYFFAVLVVNREFRRMVCSQTTLNAHELVLKAKQGQA